MKALRDHVDKSGKNDHPALSDRELVEHLVERIVVSACAIRVYAVREPHSPTAAPVINIPWMPAKTALAKGVIGPPPADHPTNVGKRDAPPPGNCKGARVDR